MDQQAIRNEPARLRRKVIHLPPKRKPLDLDDLVRRYHAGHSAEQIGADYRVSSSTVLRRLRAAGVTIRDASQSPRPRRPPIHLDVEDIVRRYQAGATPEEIAAATPASAGTIRRRLSAAGVLLDPAAATRRRFATRPEATAQARAAQAIAARRRRRDEHAIDIIDAYMLGESARAVAARFGVAPDVVRRILCEHRVPIRTHSEAGKLRAAREAPAVAAARHARIAAAQTGRPLPAETLARRARTKQTWEGHIGQGEDEMVGWLADRGVQLVRQYPVDQYNIDIAVWPVAVEIHRAANHPLGRDYLRSRIEHLSDRGWLPLYFWITTRVPLIETAADQAVSLIDLARRDPTAFGQYRVIRGNGELAQRWAGSAALPGRRGNR